MFLVIVLESPIPTLVEGDDECHHLTGMQPSRTATCFEVLLDFWELALCLIFSNEKKSSISQKSDTICMGELLF